ncbi:cytochrome P450 [Sphingobium aromaticiconvertens]|uniref:cytochrome P450 n=1 Tax=Sphingobium aromaticiconvertens TaxID=365341 RepID=UPI00301ADBA5
MATQLDFPPAHVDPARAGHCALFDRKIVYESPYETIIPQIHEGPAVFYADNISFQQPGWVVRRHEDLKKIYNDAENFHKSGNTGFARLIGEDWSIIPTELDPPVHTGFRQALNPIFSPSKMMQLDEMVRTRARHFIDKFKDKGSCEFVADFAINFPISIFLDLIGLPQERTAQFLDWENKLLHGTDLDARISSVHAVKNLLLETIADRKKRPGDDLISKTLALEVDGRKWTDDEVFGHCFNLYIGGLDTVTSNMSLHFQHLATHPEDQARMRDNSFSQNVVAIEELLRAYAAVSTNRICSKPYEIDGQTMMPGDYVIMSTPLAGRDPEAYDAPNEVRLGRKPTHVTLGHGIHRCLGQHLARRELQTAIEEFLKAIPRFSIEPGFKTPFFLGNVIHVPVLPLTWN